MLDLSKSYEFFQPESLRDRLHIIGCGAIGSTLAENLVRFGIRNITLYDFDQVEAHNIANQIYRQKDIGQSKIKALAEYLCEINPDCAEGLRFEPEGWRGQPLSGYVFLCVDRIELRREIASHYQNNPYIKGMFDFRMGLTDAQHYAADWNIPSMVANFLKSMEFSHAEAQAETPVSACNLPLSVVPTVRIICAYGVANFINFLKGKPLRQLILADAFQYTVDAF